MAKVVPIPNGTNVSNSGEGPFWLAKVVWSGLVMTTRTGFGNTVSFAGCVWKLGVGNPGFGIPFTFRTQIVWK